MDVISEARFWWVDIVVLVVLVGVHVAAWWTADRVVGDDDPTQASSAFSAIRGAVTAGLTAAGILAPLSLIAITVGTGDTATSLPNYTVAELFEANLWLLVSVTAGIVLLYLSALRPSGNPLNNRWIGIWFGVQLIFLLVAMARFVFAVQGVAEALISN